MLSAQALPSMFGVLQTCGDLDAYSVQGYDDILVNTTLRVTGPSTSMPTFLPGP